MAEARASRILIVDDDRALAETLSEGLADRGYEAAHLASSAEAARRLGTDEVDALVTDLRMHRHRRPRAARAVRAARRRSVRSSS